MKFWQRVLILVAVCILAVGRAWAEEPSWTPLGAVQNVGKTPSGVVLRCSDGVMVVRVVAPDVIRVRVARTADELQDDHSWAVLPQAGPVPRWTLRQSNATLSVETDVVGVQVELASGRASWWDVKRHAMIVGEHEAPGFEQDGRATRELQDMGVEQHFYGLGEKAAHLDKRRQRFTMWNSDTPGWTEGADPLYQSIPFYIGLQDGRAYGIFYDNPCKSSFDFAASTPNLVEYRVDDGVLDYYFMYGPAMATVVSRYTQLTGRMPMPPRWALGNQQSRWSYYPATQAEAIVRRFRREHIPLDALHLDIHYMNGYRVFTWDPVGFPDPARFVADLLKEGVHVVTIIDPGVKYQPSTEPTQAESPTGPQEPHYYVYDEGAKGDYYVKKQDGSVYVGEVWPGKAVFVDYTLEAARRWWGGLHKALTDVGVGGVWNDMNEPADFTKNADEAREDLVFDDQGHHSPFARMRNQFAFLEARATFEGLSRLRPRQRPFIITRAGYAGIQRYSTMWTGDIPSTWDALAISVPMFESLGLSGETFVGNDVGGFVGRSNGELLTRWYEVAALTPLCRNHHVIDGYDQEPWRFGQPYEDDIRNALRLRYRLLPYLYGVLAEAHRTGLPWFRPLVLTWQNDPNTCNLDDEFMVGDALLAAPVTAPNQHSRTVYLPKGLWYDFYTEKPIQGGRVLTVAAPLSKLPLFVRGGSIVPTGPAMEWVDQIPNAPVEAVVYPDAAGHATGTSYNDDGTSPDYDSGKYYLARLTSTKGAVTTRVVTAGYRAPTVHFRMAGHP